METVKIVNPKTGESHDTGLTEEQFQNLTKEQVEALVGKAPFWAVFVSWLLFFSSAYAVAFLIHLAMF